VYVPCTVSSITLSATPGSAYEFIRFVIDSTIESIDKSTVVPISGDMSVVAEFEPASTPPAGNKDYLIKATSDEGSTIAPNGEVSVPGGENITFFFSAKSGHWIAAVYVDNVAISSEELASGKHTFFDVMSNHTISVVSKLGNGPIGEGDAPMGGGEGSDIGNSNGEWAVLNLICAILAIFTGIIAVIGGRNRFRKDDDEKKSRTALILRILTLAIGIISVIIFFLTEDWSLPVTPMDSWTLLMFILFLATLILAMSSFRFDRTPEDEGT
jgi:uncharacterized membrane protein YidH (DUF202 family)